MSDLVPAAPAELQRRDPIDAWLETLGDRQRANVLQQVAIERPVLSYLYAAFSGYEGGVDAWENYVRKNHKKLDTRAILETEIMSLREDIKEIREAVASGRMRLGESPKKLSDLSRELRGHIDSLQTVGAMQDRRSLILTGVAVCSKTLRKVFGSDSNVWPAIEAGIDSAIADIEARHGAK